jgi:UDP-2,3-diacylglucosamine pyrophosphatase LpxH
MAYYNMVLNINYFGILLLLLVLLCIYLTNTSDIVNAENTYQLQTVNKALYIFGDIGTYSDKLFDSINSVQYDFSTTNNNKLVVIVGDNFYPYGYEASHARKFQALKLALKDIDYVGILGNHDYLLDPHPQLKMFNMPNYFFDMEFDDYLLVFIDTVILEPDYTNLNFDLVNKYVNVKQQQQKQLQWLHKTLENAYENNKKVLVFGHYHLESDGDYATNTVLVNILMPIFEQYNVKNYICGHDHSMQISNVNYNGHVVQNYIIGSSSELRTNRCKHRLNNVFIEKFGYLKIQNDVIQIRDSTGTTLYEKNLIF